MKTNIFIKSVILSITFLICLAPLAQAQVCKPVAPNLAAWWTADNNALDIRNRNNGTLASGGYVGGQAGQGFNFNGSSGGFVVPDAPSLNPTTRMTFEAWVFPTSDSGSGPAFQIIANKENSSTVQYEFGRRFSGGFCPSGNNSIPTGNFAMAVGGISGLPDHCGGWVNGGANLPLNTWSHVAATYDGANLRAFVNGNQTASYAATGNIVTSNGSFRLGSRIIVPEFWTGMIDEASLYSRALSPAEIQSIHNAGTAGKCKPTAVVSPSGLVGWWAGDGNANDIAGTNNGTPQNGAGFAVGNGSQSFKLDGVDDVVTAPQSLAITSSFTAEAWVNPTSLANNPVIFERHNGSLTNRFGMQITSSGTLCGYFDSGFCNVNGGVIPTNTFTHVVYLFDDAANSVRLYVNGVQVASSTETRSPTGSNGTLIIGNSPTNGFFDQFPGQIDELSIYNRALSDAEIQSIVGAGLTGKLKTHNTTGTTASVGDATITFTGITTAGTTHQIPLAANLFPAVPMGAHTGLFYDIATSAAFTGNPTVCFNIPSFTSAEFPELRVLHFTSGAWVNVTAASNTYPTLCTIPVSSFSAFAIVDLTPLAAEVSVSGRVTTAGGRGIGKARVSLTDMNGQTRTAITNPFGYYRFDEVAAGETYIITVSHKRYVFDPNSQVLSVVEELEDVNFVADE